MRAADPQLVGGDAVEHAPARRAGGLRIDVEDEPGIGPRDLDRRECTRSPQISRPSLPDWMSQPVWPGVWPGSRTADTPGTTSPSRTVRMRLR